MKSDGRDPGGSGKRYHRSPKHSGAPSGAPLGCGPSEGCDESLLEINLEAEPDAASLFESKDPKRIVELLAARYAQRVVPGSTLLFLDEIQSAPELLACLRYFHERMPELHVIAAGSLLDFALREPTFSMPVGRIEYLHLGPMTFDEFLLALEKDSLVELLEAWSVGQDVPAALHNELSRLVCRSSGLTLIDLEEADDILLVNSGALCEQFVGQHLVQAGEAYDEPEAFCWMREKSQSNAEVDYVISMGETVVPVDVKSGKTGTLKSLHVFLRQKERGFALRFNTDAPSLLDAVTSLAGGGNRPFRLLSLPLYMIGQARRLCQACI